MRTRLSVAAVAGATLLSACDLDLNNPNVPTEGDVLKTREGIVALAIGLQARYGAGMVDFMFPVGLLTDELGATSGALQSYKDAENNLLLNTYDAVQLPWLSHYRTIKTANDLIVNAPNVTLGDSTLSGILSISYLLKAMSLGELLQLYEQIAVDTYNEATPAFVNRATALAAVLALLDSALTQYDAVRPGSEFNGSIRATGFDVRNTILAMQARYHRLSGNDAQALAAADSVNPSVLSVMPFSDQALNPIFDLSFRAAYVKPRDAWRLSLNGTADSLDGRPAYHVTVASITGNVSALDNLARYAAASSPVPFYYPGEMRLIIAEALTNLGNLTAARDTVNFVRTKCGGSLAEPQACLAALDDTLLDTPAELLDEIYHQRRYESFATGLRWEDARRRDAIGAGGFAKRCWLLYPRTERETNPNTPTDPPDALTAC